MDILPVPLVLLNTPEHRIFGLYPLKIRFKFGELRATSLQLFSLLLDVGFRGPAPLLHISLKLPQWHTGPTSLFQFNVQPVNHALQVRHLLSQWLVLCPQLAEIMSQLLSLQFVFVQLIQLDWVLLLETVVVVDLSLHLGCMLQL